MELIIIYDGDDKCEKCLGWKRIDDGDDGTSWKYWDELPEQSKVAIKLGIVKPIPCPDCNGSGKQQAQKDL